MNKCFYPVLVIFLLAGCAENRIYRTVEVSFLAPLFLFSGGEIDMKQEFSIYSLKSTLVYELPYFMHKETDSVSTNVKKFFIFKRGAYQGLMYFPALPQGLTVYKVDSVLKAETLTGFGDILTVDTNVFVSRSVLEDTIKEVYVPKIRKDFTYPDTVVISYLTTKLDLDYSLSKSIEKVKNKTVVKVNSIFEPTIAEGISLPKRSVVFKLKVVDEIPKEQLKKIQTYLKKFRQDSQKLIKAKR